MSGIVLREIDDLPPEEAAAVREAVAEAERGYDPEELVATDARLRGRPLSVGVSPANTIVRARLDAERNERLNRYVQKRHLTRSAAVRELLDYALERA